MTDLLLHRDHCIRLLDQVIPAATRSLWIITADIKDLHVARGKRYIPFLGVLADLVRGGVSIRMVHAKEPGPRFRQDFDRFPELVAAGRKFERVLCPRVHMKVIIVDHRIAYIGSANLTGAGLGAKSPLRRNFEAGILTDEPGLVQPLIEEVKQLWAGSHCQKCGRRDVCPDPIA